MVDLPRGTVTFLFTDIEGSTALWERDRQVMADAVQRHIARLDAAINAHGGIHFKTVGNAIQAASPTAPEVVAAAVAGERALLAEDWGEAEPDARGHSLADLSSADRPFVPGVAP
jgi:class 3 adenylate cyclase